MSNRYRRRRLLEFVGLVAILGWPSISRALDGVEQWFDDQQEEELVVFPTYATLGDDGGVTIPVHAWTFEPEEDSVARDAFVSMLQETLGLESEETNATFERRIRPFLVDNERGKKVELRVGDRSFEVGITRPDGHVQSRIDVPREAAARALRVDAGRRWLEPTVDAGFTEKSLRIPVVEDHGWTVVSDIDDTIKITEVLDRSRMLENTFLRDFEAVDGMAQLYEQLADRLDAHFHYLSASPWQLLPFLESFLHDTGFAPGVFHLRKLRPKSISSPLDFVSGSRDYKEAELDAILSDFPERRFLLVGDSGEHDPEIYGELARRYPDRIRAIWIREVDGATNSDERFQQAFREVDAGLWQTFVDPNRLEIPTPAQEEYEDSENDADREER